MIDWSWVRDRLGIGAIARETANLQRKLTSIQSDISVLNQSLLAQTVRFTSLEKEIMTLAEKIKALVAVETAEGAKLQESNAKLSESLAKANARIAELEALPKTEELEAAIAALKAELAEANAAADEIAAINPTPVADGVVDEVVENPEIPTPPIVEEAPAPTPDTIPDLVVVEAAIEAIDAAG